jgi:hypothetical protein
LLEHFDADRARSCVYAYRLYGLDHVHDWKVTSFD